jgi:hypothetical protein
VQVPILQGVYTDSVADFRTSYPRNRLPVPKSSGISEGSTRPAPGIKSKGDGPGIGRGGVNWNGVEYRVSGSKLLRVPQSGAPIVLGDVGDDGRPARFTYSFDRLAIASAKRLYYWNGSTLTRVTDPDLGDVLDVNWIAGYFMTTDGTSLIVTDLTNPMIVNPLHYGSAESAPDPVYGVGDLREEAYAFGRYTIQVFENVGGTGFPFTTIKGATVPRGCVGTHAVTGFAGTFAFVGGGRTKEGPEPSAVWLMTPGDAARISTREIDTLLQGYTDDELAACVVESRIDKGNQELLVHLPDRCLVYDLAASQVVGEPVWTTRDSGDLGAPSQYRARGHVWCYGRWNVDDPTSTKLGTLVEDVSDHYGEAIGWDFGTLALYNESHGAIVHNMELVALTGRVALGSDPVIWMSFSSDGQTWSQERARSAGKRGDRMKRLAWRDNGEMQNWRVWRFRGTSDAHVSFARLEMEVEALST